MVFLSFLIYGFNSCQAINEHAYKVVGYYPNWGMYRSPSFQPKDINPDLVTHINYAFVRVDQAGNLHLFDPWADIEHRTDWNSQKPYWGNFLQLKEMKEKNPHLKTLVSLGGWTLSEPFSAMAADPVARENFVKQSVEFCEKYDFDGIDIDWEYPGFANHGGRPEDTENFTLLLQELSKASKQHEPQLLVTIAAPAGPTHYKNKDVGTGTTAEAGMRFFFDIKRNLLSSYTRYWDDTAKVPYLYNAKTEEFVTYEDEESLMLKCQYVKDNHLGGAMVWELGLDTWPDWEAMKAIDQSLKQ